MAASSTVAAGRPALLSSLLMLSTVSLPAIASAAPWSAAMMPVSTRMASARRCRRLPMLSILCMTTDSLETPAACASEDLNAVCLSSVKADGDMGKERAIRTS